MATTVQELEDAFDRFRNKVDLSDINDLTFYITKGKTTNPTSATTNQERFIRNLNEPFSIRDQIQEFDTLNELESLRDNINRLEIKSQIDPLNRILGQRKSFIERTQITREGALTLTTKEDVIRTRYRTASAFAKFNKLTQEEAEGRLQELGFTIENNKIIDESETIRKAIEEAERELAE